MQKLVQKLKDRYHLEVRGVDGRTALTLILNKGNGGCGLELSASERKR
jgi:hypothetical protein